MTEFKLSKIKSPTDAPSFCEASADELRVLIALLESSGETLSYAKLAKRAAVSEARARSATVLWRAEGIIGDSQDAPIEDNVRDEFNTRFSSDMYDESSKETARVVRDGELAELLEECATLMGKAALSTEEVKKITSIYSQLALSVEFILTLAMHIAEHGDLTAVRLAKKAESLVNSGVDNIEALGIWIEDRGSESDVDMEFRRLFGIWNRKLSPSNREYFRKWSEDYAYGTPVVSLAYDLVSISSGKLSFTKMDKIITDWHENGAKTLEECEARYMEFRRTLAEESEKKRETLAEKTSSRRPKKEKPRYGDFDAEEAFKLALSRSFFDEDGGKEN